MTKLFIFLMLLGTSAFAERFPVGWSDFAGYTYANWDPTVVPTNANKGTLLFNTSNNIYIKNDDGISTNWIKMSGGGGTPGGANFNVQLNSSGAFSGNGNFNFNPSTGQVYGGGLGMALSGGNGVGNPAMFQNVGALQLSSTSNASKGPIFSNEDSPFFIGPHTAYEQHLAQISSAATPSIFSFNWDGADTLSQLDFWDFTFGNYNGGADIAFGSTGSYSITGATVLGQRHVTGISDTSSLSVNGMVWDPTDFPPNTYVVSIDSGSQITVSNNALDTNAAASMQIGGYPVANQTMLGLYGNEFDGYYPNDRHTHGIFWYTNEQHGPNNTGSDFYMTQGYQGTNTNMTFQIRSQQGGLWIVNSTNTGSPPQGGLILNNYQFTGTCTLGSPSVTAYSDANGGVGASNAFNRGDFIMSPCFTSGAAVRIVSVDSATQFTVSEPSTINGSAQTMSAINSFSLGAQNQQDWGGIYQGIGSIAMAGYFSMVEYPVGWSMPFLDYGDTLYFTTDHATHYEDNGYGNTSGIRLTHDLTDYSKWVLTTTNNTQSTIATIPFSNNTAYLVDAKCVARRTDSAGRAAYHFSAVFYREAGGIVTRQGSGDTSLVSQSSDGSWAAGFYADGGNNLLIKVTGDTGNTIDWYCGYNQTYVQ